MNGLGSEAADAVSGDVAILDAGEDKINEACLIVPLKND